MVSFALNGVGVSGGIASGARSSSRTRRSRSRTTHPASKVEAEIARFTSAVKEVQKELEGLHAAHDQRRRARRIRRVPRRALDDPHRSTLSETPKKIILEQRCNAEWALTQQMGVLVDQFDQIEDAYLRERKGDIVQVASAILKRLMGKPGRCRAGRRGADDPRRARPVARGRDPVQASPLRRVPHGRRRRDVAHGIVARSLNVPAVVATHNAAQLIRDSELLIVDGDSGVVIINPDRAVLAEYRLKQSEIELRGRSSSGCAPSRPRRSTACASSSTPTSSCRGSRADARERRDRRGPLPAPNSSFLNREGLPSEDEQFEAYRAVAEGMTASRSRSGPSTSAPTSRSRGSTGSRAWRPTRRSACARCGSASPSLACSLTQLRAILRASHYGNVRILVPSARLVVRDRADARRTRAGQREPQGPGRAVRARRSRSAA
jgi:phosphotransferase system enzyme I (PtsI)